MHPLRKQMQPFQPTTIANSPCRVRFEEGSFPRNVMSDVHPRHRYGTYALILALLALAFAGFSKGAVWATVDDESSTTVQDEFFGELFVNVTIESDLHLREWILR